MDDYTQLNKAQRRKVVAENKGILTRVARRIGVSQPTVSQVFHGKMTSRRVGRALNEELRKLGVIVRCIPNHESSVTEVTQ